MKLISFELTMPNRGSWNGRWSGEANKYYVIKKLPERYFKDKVHLQELLQDGKDSWYYRWDDGWGASVTAQLIDSKEASKRRKISKGFCGYEWMIGSILSHGAIYASHDEIPKTEPATS